MAAGVANHLNLNVAKNSIFSMVVFNSNYVFNFNILKAFFLLFVLHVLIVILMLCLIIHLYKYLWCFAKTGSGKTFTITGGAERYVDRGLIPRSLSYLYSELVKVCQ